MRALLFLLYWVSRSQAHIYEIYRILAVIVIFVSICYHKSDDTWLGDRDSTYFLHLIFISLFLVLIIKFYSSKINILCFLFNFWTPTYYAPIKAHTIIIVTDTNDFSLEKKALSINPSIGYILLSKLIPIECYIEKCQFDHKL